jgi:hypothetical protein
MSSVKKRKNSLDMDRFEKEYLGFLRNHSAAVTKSLRKLGKHLQNFQLSQDWLIRVIALGAELRNLIAKGLKVNPQKAWVSCTRNISKA